LKKYHLTDSNHFIHQEKYIFMTNIHQISIDHDPLEDRVLVRMNTQNKELVEVWLTRKISLQLLPALEKLNVELLNRQKDINRPLNDEQSKLHMADLIHQQTLENSNFSTPFEQLKDPLTGPRPLLVTNLQATLLDNAGLKLDLSEKIKDNERMLELTLDKDLLQGFKHLLFKAIEISEWKLALDANLGQEGSYTPDLLAAWTSNSGYLN
jgi:hypothetical protein